MWKTAGYALLWLLGSAAAVGVAWTGVAVVDDDIIPAPALPQPADDRLDSAQQQLDRTDNSRSGSTIGAIGPTGARSPEADDRPTASTAAGSSQRTIDTGPDGSSGAVLTPGSVSTTTDTTSSDPPPTTTAASSTSRSTTTTPGQTTRTTAPSISTTRPTTTQPAATASTTTTTRQATTAAPPTTIAQTETRTFHLVGGSTAISFSPAEVRVLWATPKPGFDVDVGSGGPGMRVEFEADDLESRIDVWWDDGPQHEIRER